MLLVFSLTTIHTPYPFMTRQNPDLWYWLVITLNSVLSWSTSGSNYSLRYFWIWCEKPYTPGFGCFLTLLGTIIGQPFSRFSRDVWEGSNQAMVGPLKGIYRVVPKLLLCCLSCVLMVIVLLEGDCFSQPEVLSALNQVLIKDISIYCSSTFLLSWQVPAAEKYPIPWCNHHHASLLG